MNTTLICTVGGSHEPIVTAIKALKPGYVCFVCSGDDPASRQKGSYAQISGKGNVIKADSKDEKATLPNIPTQTGLAGEQFEILQVAPDDFDDVYRSCSNWLRGRGSEVEQLVADYTGGTKTMSAALVVAALDQEGIELQLVTGSRANLVKVDSGTQYAVPASVEATRFERQLQQALAPWAQFAYDEAAELLDHITPPRDPQLRGDYQRARDLSRAFALWDRFNHSEARQIIQPYRPVLGPTLATLLTALDLMNSEKSAAEPLRLFDLWHNAGRRAAQGRYDDAVARLYRLLEWSAQWLLRAQAGIDTADVPEDRIPEGMALSSNREGKYQAGLFAAWELAALHGNDAAANFWHQERDAMLDRIQARNHSILAHGYQPLGTAEWETFSWWAEQKLLPLILEQAHCAPFRVHQMPPQLPGLELWQA